MIEVSKDEFFAKVGHLDVLPHPRGPYSSETGYEVDWELRNRTLVGHSNGTASNRRYWVSEALS